MFSTDFFFTPGKLSILLDGGFGSSGKGKLESFICEHANNWQFACCTYAPQAGHITRFDDGRSFFYQTFNACAHDPSKYEKLYIGPGGTIEPAAFWREIKENNIPHNRIGISPLTSILQPTDGDFEKGLCDLDGKKITISDGGYLAKTGTTAHGCGINRARRMLRRKEAIYARDITEFHEFICDVPGEIMARLDKGQSGVLSIAQGYALSNMLPEFYPYITSRNITVAAGMDDMMLPVHLAGNVVLNFRAYPIRINSNKYIDTRTSNHLTWAEVLDAINKIDPALPAWDKPGIEPNAAGLATVGINMVKGNSGPWYDDQTELTWEELTKLSGSPEPLFECTSVTRLPRRVSSWSYKNLEQAIKHNRANGEVFLSVNFMNYVDYEMTGRRGVDSQHLSDKANKWLADNLGDKLPMLRFIGTGARTDDTIQINQDGDTLRPEYDLTQLHRVPRCKV